jgi:uncharacterized phage protein gp47/JayE
MLPVKKTYRQIAHDILTQITGGEVVEQYTYMKGIPCRLTSIPVSSVNEIVGVSKGSKRVFVRDVDYRLRGDSVEWVSGRERPDEQSQFSVSYVFARQSGISDLSPGSVVRTIVEAISREIEYLYIQMNQAYLSGFLDTADGDALNLVVSLLGISRKPPQPSTGYVTFGRTSEPEVMTVTGEALLYEELTEYALKKPLVKEILKIEGTSNGTDATFENGVDYVLAGKSVRWLPQGKKPDVKTVFRVDYSVYREIIIPKGTSVATFSAKPEDVRVFTAIEEALLSPSSESKWESDIPVACTVPGLFGNVLSGSVTVMPRPITGVEYVINKADLTNGIEAEKDPELRQRAKHALEFAGKATYASLESAIRSIEGVRSLLIKDMPQNLPGIVKVIVDGGDMESILHVINETRAAGVRIEVFRPKIVHINISLTLTLETGVTSSWAGPEVDKRVRSYVSSLEIGDDVLYSKVIEAALSVSGVVDVRDVLVIALRPEGFYTESDRENIEISDEERAEPRNIRISVEEEK